jgi:SET domain-containing protein
MKSDQVEIKDSEIHGKGVFAARDFECGEVVLRWDSSHVVSNKKAKEASKKDGVYVNFVDDKYILMQDPEKYVNHSCEPNTTIKNACDVAIRDIKKGEEITGDYTEDSPFGFRMKCNCRKDNCNKTIEK